MEAAGAPGRDGDGGALTLASSAADAAHGHGRAAVALSDAQWTSLARDLRRVLDRAAPQWTDTNAHDPGVTLVALLGFVAEELAYRSGTLSEPARRLGHDVARRAAALASALETGADDGCDGRGLQRVRYFSGQRLGADEFQTEQDYVLDRLARRNRVLHGAGIVAGLDVTIDPGGGSQTPRVVIAPGLAFDQLGREIAVDAAWSAPLPATGNALLVQLGYSERACRAVPVPDTSPDAATTQATRIVETFAATLAPTPVGDAIVIARVHRSRGRWRVDPKFTPPRVRA